MNASPVYELFRQAAERNPARVALYIGDTIRRYEELFDEVAALSGHLQAAGVRPGDHIGTLLPNGLAFVQLLLAAARIGAVLVPLPLSSTPTAIRKAFASATVGHAVCWHAAGEALEAASGVGGLQLSVGGETTGWQRFEELTTNPLSAVADTELSSYLPYLILLTSGSTGNPKPILLSQTTKVARARAAVALYDLRDNEIVLAATPLHHSLAQRLVLIALLNGGTSVVLERYSPSTWLETINRHRVTFTMAVSAQLKQIVPLLKSQAPPTSLRCLVSSSATLDPDTKAALLAHTNCAFHEIYGTSEIASATNLAVRKYPEKLNSVGLPTQDVEIIILGTDGQPNTPNQPGEILCRTPLAFDGYFGLPKITSDAYWQDFFRTGDLGTMDADGFLYFLGRIKDIVIVGGINIYPRDIEEVVEAFPNIAEAAAIALDDPQLGEVIGLVVTSCTPSIPLDQPALLRHCIAQLNDAQIPRHIFQLDAMPHNEMGKIDKPLLRSRFSQLEKRS